MYSIFFYISTNLDNSFLFQKWTNELVRSLEALRPALNGRHPHRRRQRRRWANAIWKSPNGKRKMIACMLSVPSAMACQRCRSRSQRSVAHRLRKCRYVLNNVDRVCNCGDHYVIISGFRTEQTRIYGKPEGLSGYSFRENSTDAVRIVK